jgi:hypothetical protein
MVSIAELFKQIASRTFAAPDAKWLVKSSYYFAGTHADVHIILAVRRPPDYYVQSLPKYADRSLHSMFESMDDAATAIAAALNCRAGEATVRFLSVSGVEKVALYSRTGARVVSRMAIRSAGPEHGGAAHIEKKVAAVVVVVLSIRDGQIVLTTAYPAHSLINRPMPPRDSDLVEIDKEQVFSYTVEI